jgi:hypothetical protein
MTEIRVEKDKDTWDLDLYDDGSFIKTICTCYEEDYVIMITEIMAKKILG